MLTDVLDKAVEQIWRRDARRDEAAAKLVDRIVADDESLTPGELVSAAETFGLNLGNLQCASLDEARRRALAAHAGELPRLRAERDQAGLTKWNTLRRQQAEALEMRDRHRDERAAALSALAAATTAVEAAEIAEKELLAMN